MRKWIDLLQDDARVYQEDPGSSFTHDGNVFSLNELLRLSADLPVERFAIEDLAWVLVNDTPDAERVEKADPSVPILVVSFEEKLTVIDGLHRLAKAQADGAETIVGRHVSYEMLQAARLDVEFDRVWYDDASENYYRIEKLHEEEANPLQEALQVVVAKLVAELDYETRDLVNICEGSTPFTDNMIPACSAAQVGFYFEEGGCWGMALALFDKFRSLGLHPELVVTPNQGHALVRLGSELFDHSGETFTKLPLKVVTVQGLIDEAEIAGVSDDELMADRQLAAEIIENAATSDWPVDESAKTLAFPTNGRTFRPMNEHVLLEMSMRLSRFKDRVAHYRETLTEHLLKLIAIQAPEDTRTHWKSEVINTCTFKLTGLTIKQDRKPNRPPRPAEFMEILFNDDFGDANEVSNINRDVSYILTKYRQLRRNTLTDEQVREELRRVYSAIIPSMCSAQFDRAQIERL